MHDLFSDIAKLVSEGRPFVLATVIDSSGSTPQKPGSKMVVLDRGETRGTVGGGAIEQQIVDAARALLLDATQTSKLVETHLTHDLGMCCGGRMRVFLEKHGAAAHLYIFGAGHVAKELAALASRVGFRVHVTDERADWASAERDLRRRAAAGQPRRHRARSCPSGPDCFFCITTHDHPLDQACVEALLRKPSAYVGVIGSRRKAERFRMRLKAQGFTDLEVSRMHSPMGVDIGALSPAEIAVSIVGELIGVRLATVPRAGSAGLWADLGLQRCHWPLLRRAPCASFGRERGPLRACSRSLTSSPPAALNTLRELRRDGWERRRERATLRGGPGPPASPWRPRLSRRLGLRLSARGPGSREEPPHEHLGEQQRERERDQGGREWNRCGRLLRRAEEVRHREPLDAARQRGQRGEQGLAVGGRARLELGRPRERDRRRAKHAIVQLHHRVPRAGAFERDVRARARSSSSTPHRNLARRPRAGDLPDNNISVGADAGAGCEGSKSSVTCRSSPCSEVRATASRSVVFSGVTQRTVCSSIARRPAQLRCSPVYVAIGFERQRGGPARCRAAQENDSAGAAFSSSVRRPTDACGFRYVRL